MIRILKLLMLVPLCLCLQGGCVSFGNYDLRTGSSSGWLYGPTFSAYGNGVIKGEMDVRELQATEMRNNAYKKAQLCRESRHVGPGGWFSGSADCVASPGNPIERAILEQAAREGDAAVAAQMRAGQQQDWDNGVNLGRGSVRVPVR